MIVSTSVLFEKALGLSRWDLSEPVIGMKWCVLDVTNAISLWPVSIESTSRRHSLRRTGGCWRWVALPSVLQTDFSLSGSEMAYYWRRQLRRVGPFGFPVRWTLRRSNRIKMHILIITFCLLCESVKNLITYELNYYLCILFCSCIFFWFLFLCWFLSLLFANR